MADVVCARIRLKPDSLPRVREWAHHLHQNRDRALQTLAAEGVTVESVFLESIAGDGDYLVYYMRATSLQHAAQVAATSVAEIDVYHREFKKATWEQVSKLEMLIDLTQD